MESPPLSGDRELRRNLVTAVRAAVRLFKPLLDAVVTKYVLAARKTQGSFVNAFGIRYAKLIIAYDAS